MTAPPIEPASLVAARQLAVEARERRWAEPVRRRRPLPVSRPAAR